MQSDTALVPRGGGTGGSRSLQLGGSAVLEASQLVLEQAQALAAELLEAAPDDIVSSTTAASASPACRARRSRGPSSRSQAARRRRRRSSSEHDFEQSGATFPFGAHVAVVEVDTETGRVEPIRHVAVDDCGRILNPLLVDGQQHGGIAPGIAQALWEEIVYDDDGNPLTSTLADYAHPERGRVPVVRGRAHRDADAAQPARRQGHRRVGHDRVARPRCRTRSSTR